MDPVQNDLKLLGVKPLDPEDYNIHTPPLPKDGKDSDNGYDSQLPKDSMNDYYFHNPSLP